MTIQTRFTGKAVEAVRIAIERALQGHNGPVRLEVLVVCVENHFFWQLKSIISRNPLSMLHKWNSQEQITLLLTAQTKRQKRKAVRYLYN